jgi:hypothetical protein
MFDTFKEHYTCADCVNESSCEYWLEAWHCYCKGDHDYNEILQEFRKNCEKSFREYVLERMNDWRRSTVFSHEHGKQVRWLRTGSV